MLAEAELKRILARDHGRLSKVLAALAAAGQPVKVRDIVQIAERHGFRKMGSWNVSSILGTSRGKAILIGGLWEITEDGLDDVRALVGNGKATRSAEAAVDLRTELATINDGTTRAFAEEAIRAYEAKIYRSAIVMSWITAMDVLYQVVLDTKLKEFNAQAKSVNADWKPAKDRDGLAQMKEADFLSRIAALSIIGKNVKTTLVECLNRRNGCGHPNSLKLKDRAVAHHVETLILNVFQQFGAPACRRHLRHPQLRRDHQRGGPRLCSFSYLVA